MECKILEEICEIDPSVASQNQTDSHPCYTNHLEKSIRYYPGGSICANEPACNCWNQQEPQPQGVISISTKIDRLWANSKYTLKNNFAASFEPRQPSADIHFRVPVDVCLEKGWINNSLHFYSAFHPKGSQLRETNWIFSLHSKEKP